MPPAAPHLVALDIDNTLMPWDGPVSPRVHARVEAARAAGHHVVLASGRSVPALMEAVRALDLSDGWAVCSNGAVTIRLDGGNPGFEVTDVVTFDPEPALRLLRQHLPESLIAIEDVGRGYLITGAFPDGELRGSTQHVEFETMCRMPAARVVVRDPGLDVGEFRQIVHAAGLQDVSYDMGWTSWLDLTPAGVSKASALEIIRARLAVDSRHTIAIGDGMNDVSMLRWARYGIAMGDAEPEVQAAANRVTEPMSSDGVALALDALL